MVVMPASSSVCRPAVISRVRAGGQVVARRGKAGGLH